MNNNLNTKIDRIDTAIAEMRRNLSLSNNAEIEEVASSTAMNLKKVMNVYIQEEQPSTFEGIWIQQEAEEWEHLIVDEDIAKMGEFEAIATNMKLHSEYEKLTYCNGYIYGVNNGLPMTLYKYTASQPQTIVNSYTISKDLIKEDSDNLYIFTYNNKVYIITYKAWVEFNPFTEEFRKMPDIGIYPSQYYNTDAHYAIHENNLYCISAYNSKIFNFLTEKTSTIPSRGWKQGDKSPIMMSPVVGNKIYMILGTQTVYGGVLYYNIETQTYGNDSLSEAMQRCQLADGGLNNAVLYGEYLYVIYAKYNIKNGLKRIHIKDCSIEQLAELPFSSGGNFWLYPADPTILFMDNKLYVNSGGCSNYQLYSISNDTSSYEEKTLILTQGQLYNVTRETGLYTVPATDKGRVVWPFYDINYYKNGKFSDAPMYYGTGTEWKKFKN